MQFSPPQKAKKLRKSIANLVSDGELARAYRLSGKNLPKLYRAALRLVISQSDKQPSSVFSKISSRFTKLKVVTLLALQRLALLGQGRPRLDVVTDLALVRAELQIGLLNFGCAIKEAQTALSFLSLDPLLLLLSYFKANQRHQALRKMDRFSKVVACALNSRHLIGIHEQAARLTATSQYHCSCDVIAIASDEGPYVADFVHHYLYLGFEHIFIGINNSSDETDSILSVISLEYKQVHVINTDDAHSLYGQKSSYTKLYSEARNISSSKYVLFVDIDEFWLAKPFPLKINDYLARLGHFDSMGCHWINIHESQSFAPPLSAFNEAYILGHFKSIVAYSDSLLELRCHAPLLRSSVVSYSAIDSSGVHLDMIHLPIGKEVPKGQPLTPFSASQQTSFVIHRANRSMVEYCFRMLKPHANQKKMHQQLPSDCPFKENRNGFDYRSGILLESDFLQELLPGQHLLDYTDSLKSFVDSLGLGGSIAFSRSRISEQSIEARLRTIDVNILTKHRNIWSKGFRGTSFLPLLVQLEARKD